MTRSRVKTLHDKVNSLLSMCDLDTPLNGLLLHSDTLCVLRYEPHEDLQGSVEDGQETSQEEDEQRYYHLERRYYRQGPDDQPDEAEVPGGVPGGGTTATTAVLPPVPEAGTTARATAGGTDKPKMLSGHPAGTRR